MYNIQRLYSLEIYINNRPLSEQEGVVYQGAAIHESFLDPIPTLKLQLILPTVWLDLHEICEGKPIKIILKSEVFNLDEKYEFRIHNIESINHVANEVQVVLDCVLDVFDIFGKPNTFNMYGNSSDVFRRIASECKLKSDIDDTNDRQLWCSFKDSAYYFMSRLAQHGWVDYTSAMMWTIRKDKTLLYKNITNMFSSVSSSTPTFVQTKTDEDNVYLYSNISSKSLAGKNNLQNGGYGSNENYTFDIMNYEYKKVGANEIKCNSKFLNLDKSLKSDTISNWYPFDFGNYHENYFKAVTQNQITLASYNTYTDIFSQFSKGYKLGEVVNVKYQNSNNDTYNCDALTGVYLIYDLITTFDILRGVSSNVGLVMQGYN